MNLPDLIKRSDRAVQIQSGRATPGVLKWNNQPRSVTILDPGTEMMLRRADEFLCLRGLPADIGWRVWCPEKNGERANFQILLSRMHFPFEAHVLFSVEETPVQTLPITLDWPAWAWEGKGFHIHLKNLGSSALAVDTGLSFNSRARFLPLLKGRGVEIGPGLNPHILPSEGVDVSYVESASAEEWVRNYKKTDKPTITEQNNLWSKYIVADAQMLSSLPDGSLDFIYSNHVFEHLMNPVGVLENWRRKLTTSGVIVGVVPDCRYTFDLRQSPSTVDAWLRQRSCGIWSVGREQYEQWCRYTAPYNTPENLIERNYSIHVHFYTPETFALLSQIVVSEGLFEEAVFESSANHKDFGFLLRAGRKIARAEEN
jgi:SAM-dependent methyltransferase